MSVDIDPRASVLIARCDACWQEIKANEPATAEFAVRESSAQRRSRVLDLHFLHAHCRADFARNRQLAQPNFWSRFFDPRRLAMFNDPPEDMPEHIAKILRDVKTRFQQSIEAAESVGEIAGPSQRDASDRHVAVEAFIPLHLMKWEDFPLETRLRVLRAILDAVARLREKRAAKKGSDQ